MYRLPYNYAKASLTWCSTNYLWSWSGLDANSIKIGWLIGPSYGNVIVLSLSTIWPFDWLGIMCATRTATIRVWMLYISRHLFLLWFFFCICFIWLLISYGWGDKCCVGLDESTSLIISTSTMTLEGVALYVNLLVSTTNMDHYHSRNLLSKTYPKLRWNFAKKNISFGLVMQLYKLECTHGGAHHQLCVGWLILKVLS